VIVAQSHRACFVLCREKLIADGVPEAASGMHESKECLQANQSERMKPRSFAH
jgi:hypothetical protein